MEKGQFFQWSWNYKKNHLNKDIKENNNFKKDLMNLIKTNHQIIITSNHSISSNNSFKTLLNAKIFSIFFNTVAVVWNMMILFQCLLKGWCERIKVMWIHLQEKTENRPHHQQYQLKHHLMVIVMQKLLI